MPKLLHKQLEQETNTKHVNRIGRDGKLVKHESVENHVADIVPVLSQLCETDESVDAAYLCHASVKDVFKMPKEGGFCGYRNIQMLISFILGAKSQGHEKFDRIPGVLDIQSLIENAWDNGISEVGRIQTGGIRGTRKYIGTPEVCTLSASGMTDVDLTHTRHMRCSAASISTVRSMLTAILAITKLTNYCWLQ